MYKIAIFTKEYDENGSVYESFVRDFSIISVDKISHNEITLVLNTLRGFTDRNVYKNVYKIIIEKREVL